jgi:glc operon protein GlcG
MTITLAEAKTAVERATTKARELGCAMTFVVIDAEGHMVLLEKMDGAAWLTSDIAVGKAYTAVAFRLIGERFTDSETIGHYFNETPTFLSSLGVLTHGKIIGRGGGLPIVKDGKVIGGFGVSGGTAVQDDKCAKAAVGA